VPDADFASPWPRTEDELIAVQQRLAALTPTLWCPPPLPYSISACFVCFPKGFVGPGGTGDRAWAAAVVMTGGRIDADVVCEGTAPAAYRSGFLALREGPLLEEVIHALPLTAEVLLIDASGRDHPRRAGLAFHLGARLGVPTIGVTDRPLVAQGEWPPDHQGAFSPVRIHEEVVGLLGADGPRSATAGRPRGVANRCRNCRARGARCTGRQTDTRTAPLSATKGEIGAGPTAIRPVPRKPRTRWSSGGLSLTSGCDRLVGRSGTRCWC
jgi:deoxyribonuclease V